MVELDRDPVDERLEDQLDALNDPREKLFFAIGYLEAEYDPGHPMREALEQLADEATKL